MARRVLVFFYGLFMDTALLRARGLEPLNPRRARVPGMRLRVGRRAALEVDADGEVYGVLVELTHAEIERLYAEPGLEVYRPEAVTAEPETGSPVAALCFNLPSAPVAEERNPDYVRQLRAIATEVGLPGHYLDGLDPGPDAS